MRDKHYKVFCARLADDYIKELRKRRQKFKSWNLLFKELLKLENSGK